VYDETRRVLDEETLNGIEAMLEKYECHSILEIGIGTGRVGLPLSEKSFDVSGVDISKRMMEKAKLKGIKNLILSDGSRVPFKDRSFDAILLAHVFHLLNDPISVMREGARVSKLGVFALVRKRTNGARPWFWAHGLEEKGAVREKSIEKRRERLRKIAEKYGYKWDPAQRLRNWEREREILKNYPPDDIGVVSEVMVNESIEERISRFEKGAYSFMAKMPEELKKAIIEEMRSYSSLPSVSQKLTQPRTIVYQLAMWKPQTLLEVLQRDGDNLPQID
jgi:ubiquinone/menaquinone biosynthesis C-methylase UbiE